MLTTQKLRATCMLVHRISAVNVQHTILPFSHHNRFLDVGIRLIQVPSDALPKLHLAEEGA
jgi:hypothetical protein